MCSQFVGSVNIKAAKSIMSNEQTHQSSSFLAQLLEANPALHEMASTSTISLVDDNARGRSRDIMRPVRFVMSGVESQSCSSGSRCRHGQRGLTPSACLCSGTSNSRWAEGAPDTAPKHPGRRDNQVSAASRKIHPGTNPSCQAVCSKSSHATAAS